jgi:hypothetical protein
MANTTPEQSRTPDSPAFWSLRREASLNWLALGLLLAAWNASDNDAHNEAHNDTHNEAHNDQRKASGATERRRPEALRGYTYVSVRAANRVTARD